MKKLLFVFALLLASANAFAQVTGECTEPCDTNICLPFPSGGGPPGDPVCCGDPCSNSTEQFEFCCGFEVEGVPTVCEPNVGCVFPAPGLCDGLVSAAFGLCTAATHLECGTEAENNSAACAKIERNFVRITGEIPPWLSE